MSFYRLFLTMCFFIFIVLFGLSLLDVPYFRKGLHVMVLFGRLVIGLSFWAYEYLKYTLIPAVLKWISVDGGEL